MGLRLFFIWGICFFLGDPGHVVEEFGGSVAIEVVCVQFVFVIELSDGVPSSLWPSSFVAVLGVVADFCEEVKGL